MLPLIHVFPACGAAFKSCSLAGGQWGWAFEGSLGTLVLLLLSVLFLSVRVVVLLCCRLPEAPGPTDYGWKHQNYEQKEPFSLYMLIGCWEGAGYSNRELTEAIAF